MFSLLITVISIREVAEIASGTSRRQIIKQEKFMREIYGRKLKCVYRCEPHTGPPDSNLIPTFTQSGEG